jgi:hypothetical protein
MLCVVLARQVEIGGGPRDFHPSAILASFSIMFMVMIIRLVGQANDAVDGEASEMLNRGGTGLERHGHV